MNNDPTASEGARTLDWRPNATATPPRVKRGIGCWWIVALVVVAGLTLYACGTAPTISPVGWILFYGIWILASHLSRIEGRLREMHEAPPAVLPTAQAMGGDEPTRVHGWTHSRFVSTWEHENWSFNFETMVLYLEIQFAPGSGCNSTCEQFLIRRISASHWERKLHPKYRENRLSQLKQKPLPDDPLDRHLHNQELESLEQELNWDALSEEFIAPVETQYQRYLLQRG